MNASRFSVLICLAAGLGCAAHAAEAYNSPSRELLESSYYYQLPPFAYSNAGAANFDSNAKKPFRYNIREIEDAITAGRKHRNEALITRTLFHHQKLEFFAKPDVQEITIPWSPTTQMDDAPYTPGNAARKLQVQVPLVKVMF